MTPATYSVCIILNCVHHPFLIDRSVHQTENLGEELGGGGGSSGVCVMPVISFEIIFVCE